MRVFQLIIRGALIAALILPGPLPVEAQMPGAISLSDLAIPESLGKINERFQGTSERWVIQIQDIHAHFTAQENIAAIVDHLNAAYGMQTVALEGGWSESSFPKSWALPTSREKQMLARSLLEEAHIGGPAFAALFSKMPIQIVGIEDPNVYNENLDLYLQHIQSRSSLIAQLNSIEKKIASAKVATFNPLLQSFDRRLAEFREGGKADKFLPSLIDQAGSLDIDLSGFNQVLLFKEIVSKERHIVKSKLEDEASRLMAQHRQSRLTFEEILRSGKIPPEKIQFYPQSQMYAELLKLQDKISHRAFFAEIEDVTLLVKEKLYKTAEEKELDRKSDIFQKVRSILLFKATPSDLASYQERRSEMDAEIKAWGLETSLELAEGFYQKALARDKIFFEQLKNNARLQKDLIVVAGGFHTEGLSQLLKEAGVSYMVITPELGGKAADEDLYFTRLQDKIPQIQMLSHEKNRFVFLDANFSKAIHEMGNNLFKGISIATRYELIPGAGTTPTRTDSFSANALTHETFMAMPDNERRDFVKQLYNAIMDPKIPIAMILKTSMLIEFLKDPTGEILWQEAVAKNRANSVILIRDSDEILDATIGISARVDRVPGEMAIADIVRTRLRHEKNIAVIDAQYLLENPDPRVLALPAHPVSLLIARVMLEQGVHISMDVELLSALHEELTQIFIAEGLLHRSA